MKVLIIGAGAFGTALATTLAKKNPSVSLWVPNEVQRKKIITKGINEKYLPGIKLSKNLIIQEKLETVASEVDIILLCLPAQKTKPFLIKNKNVFAKRSTIVLCGKGIDAHTLDLQSNILKSILPKQDYAILSGPGFADEIAQDLPTAMVIAHSKIKTAKNLQSLLSTKTLRLYSSNDPIGVQLGGALKNVIAISCGIAVGLNLGESAKASLMIRGFSEIYNISIKLGARRKTLLGLSGFGDLALTCNSEKSRNFTAGVKISRKERFSYGKPQPTTIEGIKTAEATLKIAKKLELDMPIFNAVTKVFKESITPQRAAELLLKRPLRVE